MDTALLIEKLNNTHSLNKDEALQLIRQGSQHKNLLFALAQQAAQKSFGRQIFVRGLIEFTNYCKNDCYYCGIRRSNNHAARYRLTQEEILPPLYAPLKRSILTAPLRFPSASAAVKPTPCGNKQAPTVIFCATKQQIVRITPNCIRQN